MDGYQTTTAAAEIHADLVLNTSNSTVRLPPVSFITYLPTYLPTIGGGVERYAATYKVKIGPGYLFCAVTPNRVTVSTTTFSQGYGVPIRQDNPITKNCWLEPLYSTLQGVARPERFEFGGRLAVSLVAN